MISPLGRPPFLRVQSHLVAILDTISALFFKAAGCFSFKADLYGKYYVRKADSRFYSETLIPHRLIESSVNFPHPKKFKEIPRAHTFKNENIYFVKKDVPSGFCAGMSLDYMRRFKASNQSFLSTIASLAKKFEAGASKKAFIIQTLFESSGFKKDYVEALYIKHKTFSDTISKIREDLIEEMNLHFKAVHVKNDFSKENYSKVKNGDYLLAYGINPSHLICLFKRDHETALFDPNTGTYLFRSEDELFSYIERSSKNLFRDPIAFDLFQCEA